MSRASLFLKPFLISSAISISVLLAQDSAEVVILSPKVGEIIDASEREYYGLFRAVKNFSSAVIVQLPDGKFEARITTVTSTGQELTSMEMSEVFVYVLAEKIENYEELKGGTYVLGTHRPAIQIGGKTVECKPDLQASQIPRDALHLAWNTSGLSRPMFRTIHLDISFGVFFNDFSELQRLTGTSSTIAVPLSFYIHIPLIDEPSFSFIGGWGFTLGGAGGGSLSSFSATLLLCTNPLSLPIDQIVGLGVGYSIYSYDSNNLIINAYQSYPILALGLNIVPNFLDVIFTLPLVKDLRTSFESNLYSIRTVGPGLNLFLSL